MKFNEYEVILTNGLTQQKYIQYCTGEKEAIILSQAEAIRNARGYELVSVKKLNCNRL